MSMHGRCHACVVAHGGHIEVTPDIDLDHEIQGFPYFWFCVYIELRKQNCNKLYYKVCVYFRAAAYSKLSEHMLAIGDCEKALRIDPLYSKAYGRMG